MISPSLQIAGIEFTALTNAAALYRAGAVPSQPLPLVAPSISRAQPGLHKPYSEVASLSAEQALPLQTTLRVEYQHVHGVRLGRTTNSNLLPPVVLTSQNATSLGFGSPTPQQLGRPVFSPCGPIPLTTRLRGPVRKRTIKHASVAVIPLSRSAPRSLLRIHDLAKIWQINKRELFARTLDMRFGPVISRFQTVLKNQRFEKTARLARQLAGGEARLNAPPTRPLGYVGGAAKSA